MGNDDDSISRRKFLEQAGATVGAVALGNACSSDETSPDQPMTETPAGSGEGGQSSAAGAGSGAARSTPSGGGG
ncbi:MAG TPA: twin-arginine translocation signal domain-containing protein, partial [Polyangiales bacterium]|nr:twin-arginine translocation signal domain-containing protein [Polyangiales bacterium]